MAVPRGDSLMNSKNVAFIINDIIYFHPGKGILRNVDTNEEVKLNPSATKCLLLILTSEKKIVPHNIFLKKVWEDNGDFVSLNTLYQNISFIRKSLGQLEPNIKFIVTVPKHGFKLFDEIKVKLDSVDAEFNVGNHHFFNKFNKAPLKGGVFILIFVSIVVFFYLFFKKENIIDSYNNEVKVDKCLVFQKIIKNGGSSVNDILLSAGILCSRKKYVYISNKPYTDVYSVIECTNQIKSDQKVFCDAYQIER